MVFRYRAGNPLYAIKFIFRLGFKLILNALHDDDYRSSKFVYKSW